MAKAQPQTFHLAQYLIELTLLEEQMLVYSQSQIAATALWLAIRILYRSMGRWGSTMERCTSYGEADMRPCMKDMCTLLQSIKTCSL